MALMLGALIIQGIQPGPQLISEHPDIFWGLIASFWIGNILLVTLNVPLISIWVKLLTIPYRYLYPSALFFICIGVYSANNDLFEVGETLVIGGAGYVLLQLGFHPAPILLGFVLGPRFEENFRRAMLISHGDLRVFIERPISAGFPTVPVLPLAAQLFVFLHKRQAGRHRPPVVRTLTPPRWPIPVMDGQVTVGVRGTDYLGPTAGPAKLPQLFHSNRGEDQ